MKTIHRMMTAPAVAFSAFAFVVLAGGPSSAQAEPMNSGAYCLTYGDGGTDCGFTSYAQCQATASGILAECSGPDVGDISRGLHSARKTAMHD